MKNYLKFNINYNIDYILVGVRTQMEDYQFAYFLNTSPFFSFCRVKKDISAIINDSKIYFSVFKDYRYLFNFISKFTSYKL